MAVLPMLTEQEIRLRTEAKPWVRGLSYYNGNQVADVIWRDGVLWAKVEGSDYEPYTVQVTFAGEEIVATSCTCPYDWGGDCKHIVAVLLHLMHRPETVEQRPTIDALVREQPHERLAMTLLELVRRYPGLVEEIEDLLAASTSSSPSAVGTGPPAALPVDLELLRRQIKGDLRGSIETGYDSWGEERWYDSDLGAALEPAASRARALLDAGAAGDALLLLEAATRAWDDGIATLDDYFVEYFEDVAGDMILNLAALWTEAILTVDLDQEERTRWIDTLDDLADTVFGGESLEMALTAARHGWDFPPLVAAMQGNITEKGAWEDESPWFADELAEVRLRVLERRGQFREYLNLAQAEGQFMLYLHMLVKQGQSGLAVAEAEEHVQSPAEVQALAQTLLDHGEPVKALRLAQHGLALPAKPSTARLAAWLRDTARTQDEPEMALDAAQRALAAETTLANYVAVQEVAGAHWDSMRAAVLKIVAAADEVEGRVDIYLHEGMYAEAIATVDAAQWFYDIDPVIEAVKVDYPDWAFGQCRRHAEEIMDAGRAKDYDVAAEWLRRGREILLVAGKRTEWSAYLNGVMDVHQRKYKLMPMLRALG